MSRVIWNGHVSFGLVQIPVGLYPATQDDDLDLTMLDRRDHARIRYKRVNERTGEEVPNAEIVKGYEHEEGEYVLLEDADLKAANPAAAQSIELVAFVDGAALDPRWYVRPYYVAPSKKSAKSYALLRETMRRSGRVGIAKVVLRTRQYVGALMVYGEILVLELLRYPTEVRGTKEFDLPGQDLAALGIGEREQQMASLLVETLAADWEPEAYRDEYREDLMRLIEEKAHTGKVAPKREVAAAEGGEVVDLMALLKRSVEARVGTPEPAPEPAPKKPARRKKEEV